MPPKKISASCSAEELSETVAVEVAGWMLNTGHDKQAYRWINEGGKLNWEPSFATSADAVLPLLEKCKANGLWVHIKDHTNGLVSSDRDWLVIISNNDDCCDDDAPLPNPWRYYEGVSPVLARAICLCLLKANGWTVVEN